MEPQAEKALSIGLVAVVGCAVIFLLGLAMGNLHGSPLDLLVPAPPIIDPKATMTELADLAAQQSMATWAMWMFGATLAGIAVSMLSVVLLVRSLKEATRASDEARAANDLARQTHFAENRPWLSLDAQVVNKVHANDDKSLHLRVSISLVNVGATPAMDVVTHVSANTPKKSKFQDLLNESKGEALKYRMIMEQHGSTNLFPGESTKIAHSFQLEWEDYTTFLADNTDEHVQSDIIVHASYRTILDAEVRHSASVFRFEIVKDPQDESFAVPAKADLRKMFGAELVT